MSDLLDKDETNKVLIEFLLRQEYYIRFLYDTLKDLQGFHSIRTSSLMMIEEFEEIKQRLGITNE